MPLAVTHIGQNPCGKDRTIHRAQTAWWRKKSLSRL